MPTWYYYNSDFAAVDFDALPVWFGTDPNTGACTFSIGEQEATDPNFYGTCEYTEAGVNLYVASGQEFYFSEVSEFEDYAVEGASSYYTSDDNSGKNYLWDTGAKDTSLQWGSPDEDATSSFKLDMMNQTITSETWMDEEAGTFYQENTVEGADGTSTYTTISNSGCDPETMMCDENKIESIQQMSDYMWYSLDQWGRENSGSDAPQCGSATDCLGADYTSEKCCAGIAMTSAMTNSTNHYLYRCLDMGLIGMSMEFNIGSDLQVNIQCDDGPSMSSAMVLAATATAAAATIATVF